MREKHANQKTAKKKKIRWREWEIELISKRDSFEYWICQKYATNQNFVIHLFSLQIKFQIKKFF